MAICRLPLIVERNSGVCDSPSILAIARYSFTYVSSLRSTSSWRSPPFSASRSQRRSPERWTPARPNDRCSLLVEAGRISEGGRWTECGLPFGSKARLILLYMQTMAVRDQSRFIELGASLHDWTNPLGVPVGGKSYSHIRQQARRLSACTMYLGYATERTKARRRRRRPRSPTRSCSRPRGKGPFGGAG